MISAAVIGDPSNPFFQITPFPFKASASPIHASVTSPRVSTIAISCSCRSWSPTKISDTTIAAMPISSAMSFQLVCFNDFLLPSLVCALGHEQKVQPMLDQGPFTARSGHPDANASPCQMVRSASRPIIFKLDQDGMEPCFARVFQCVCPPSEVFRSKERTGWNRGLRG